MWLYLPLTFNYASTLFAGYFNGCYICLLSFPLSNETSAITMSHDQNETHCWLVYTIIGMPQLSKHLTTETIHTHQDGSFFKTLIWKISNFWSIFLQFDVLKRRWHILSNIDIINTFALYIFLYVISKEIRKISLWHHHSKYNKLITWGISIAYWAKQVIDL